MTATRPGEAQPMMVAALQSNGRGTRLDDNLALLRARSRQAAADGAQLLVAPEMFANGYNQPAQDIAARALPRGGALHESLADIAHETDIALAVGYPERDGERIFNAAVMIDASGREVLHHRKSHLFGELDRGVFTAGDGEISLTTLHGLRIGMLICYDVEFPENVRRLALAGADVVLVPTALMHPYAFVPRTLVPARAFENQLDVIYANRCGEENGLRYEGLSCIVAADGADLARAGNDECLISAALDPSARAESRRLNTYLTDRRPELYAELSGARR